MPTQTIKTRSRKEPPAVPFVDHKELHHPARLKKLFAEANRILASGEAPQTGEEASLFKAMHGCGYVLSRPKRASRKPPFSLAKVRDLRGRIRDRLVHQHIGLVYEMRRRTRLIDVDPDDLTSDGFLTLLQAVTHFDPWRGFKFSTYACTSLVRAYLLLAQRTRRTAARINVLRDEAVVNENRRFVDDREKELLVDRLRQTLAENTAELTPAERFVVERRLLSRGDTQPETLASIGRMFKLSKERVRQIQLGALQKLRTTMAAGLAEAGFGLPVVDDQGWGFEGGSLEVDEEAAIDEERRRHWG
jgi:RNA polymerase sigma factor (sigma-70 family)